MKKFLATSLLAFGLMAGSANAALLEVIGGVDVELPISYNPTPSTIPLADVGDTVTNTSETDAGGLKLGATSHLIFTFLGSEAGFHNFIFQGVSLFDNVSAVGSPAIRFNVSPDGGGFLPFKFISNGLEDVVNGDISDTFASIAFKILTPVSDVTMSVLVFLNDHFEGDADYDDMVVRIDAFESGQSTLVPLPAGLMLLLSGLMGLGFLGRARSKSA